MGFPLWDPRRLRMNSFWMAMILSWSHGLQLWLTRWHDYSDLVSMNYHYVFLIGSFCILYLGWYIFVLTEMPCQEQGYQKVSWWYLREWEGTNCWGRMSSSIFFLLLPSILLFVGGCGYPLISIMFCLDFRILPLSIVLRILKNVENFCLGTTCGFGLLV